MKYRKLGNTDIDVSLICLGTMTWGEQNNENDGFEQMDYALDQGVNFFDTAELYSVPPRKETWGSTESIIGNWFQSRKCREKVILASKVTGRSGMKWFRNKETRLNKEQITAALDGSLKRLKTDYIDLYQLHWPDRKANFFGQLTYNHQKEDIQKVHDEFIENSLSNFFLPFGVAPNFLINNKLYTIPMAIEESSVIAAASKTAKFWSSRGGFNSSILSKEKVGQIHFLFYGKSKDLISFFNDKKRSLVTSTNLLTNNMRSRGGGIKKIKLIKIVINITLNNSASKNGWTPNLNIGFSQPIKYPNHKIPKI